MTELRRFLDDVVIYATGRAANAIIPFLLVPFLTRTYAQEEFGALEILLVFVAVLGSIVSSGLPGAYAFFVRSQPYAKAKGVLVSTCLAWYLAWSLTIFGLLWLVFPPIFPAMAGRPLSNAELMLCFTFVLSQQVLGFITTILRMDKRACSVVALSTGSSLLGAVLTVTAVLWHGPTTTSYLAGFSIGTAAAATAGLLLLDTNVLRQQWNIRDLRRLLAFGLPLVPASLLELSLTLADRVIVAVFLDAFGLAAYAVAARVAGLAQLGVQSVTMALLPLSMQLLHRHERDEAGRLLGVVWRHLALIFFLGALAGTWLAPWIVALISPPAYGAAVAAIPYLMLAHVFQSFTYFTYIGTLKAERTYLYTLSVFCGVTVSITASLAVIPSLGLVGAAIGTMIGTIVTPVVSLAFSQSVWRLDLPTGRIAAMSAVALCTAVLLTGADEEGSAAIRFAATAAAIGVMAPIAVSRADLTLLRSMNRWGSPT